MGNPIFLSYDQDALDAEYGKYSDPTAAEEAIHYWEERSKSARSELNCRLDIPYGPSNSETLDVFLSSNPNPAPINVFFHGGYWRSLHKNGFSYVAYGLHEGGGITVIVNYALVSVVSFDELVRQCRSALSWIWINADSFGGDRERLFVSGHSAGGHLVAMMMATDWPAFDLELPIQLIQGGCGISGLYDLEPIRLCFLNEDLNLTEEDAECNSPSKLRPTSLSPLVLAVGAKEGKEFHRQSVSLANSWKQSSKPPELLVMPNQDHFSIATQLGDSKSDLCRTIHTQMDL